MPRSMGKRSCGELGHLEGVELSAGRVEGQSKAWSEECGEDMAEVGQRFPGSCNHLHGDRRPSCGVFSFLSFLCFFLSDEDPLQLFS